MRVKIKTLVLLATLFCIAVECKWGNILGVQSLQLNFLKNLLYIVLFFYCRIPGKKGKRIASSTKRIDILLLCIGFFLLLEVLYTAIATDLKLKDACVNAFWAYTKFVVAYPLIYLFERYSDKKILSMLGIVIGGSLLYQTFAAVVYNARGITINEYFIRSNSKWLRNGLARIGTTAAAWLLLIFEFVRSKYDNKKTLHTCIWVFVLLFFILVNQSRSMYVAAIVSLAMIYAFRGKGNKKKISALLVLCIAFVVIANTKIFDVFVSSFAKGSTDDTITSRLYLFKKYFSYSGNNYLFGSGLTGATAKVGKYLFYYIDYGIVGDYLQTGIFALVTFGGLIILTALAIRELKKVKGVSYELCVGMLTFLIVGAIGYSVLAEARNLAVPLIIAITEFFRQGSLAAEENSEYYAG